MVSDEETDETERETSAADGFIEYHLIDEMLNDCLGEPTVELKCTCGSWTTYGRLWSFNIHADYCDIRR